MTKDQTPDEQQARKPPARETDPLEPRWLTVAQAGQYLGGMSTNAVRMVLRRARIPHTTMGRRIFVDLRDIDRYMERQKTTAT